jgi:hypothetical protein
VIEDRYEDIVFVFEVEIDGSVRDAGFFGDVGDLGIEEAASGEDLDGRPKNGLIFPD